MKHFRKDEMKRILIKNLIISHKKLLFEIVDYLREFNIPEINKNFMYNKDYIQYDMEEIVKNEGCFALIEKIDFPNFKTEHNFFNYNSMGKIYSMSDNRYFINLLSCIDKIADEILKDPELLKI